MRSSCRRDYNAEKGIMWEYEEYEELKRLRAEAEEIYAQEWMVKRSNITK